MYLRVNSSKFLKLVALYNEAYGIFFDSEPGASEDVVTCESLGLLDDIDYNTEFTDIEFKGDFICSKGDDCMSITYSGKSECNNVCQA